MPRSRIYETIEKLTARGLLVSQPGEKNLLAPLDYRTFLDQKEKESAETIRILREGMATLGATEPSGIWTVSGRERILDLACDLVVHATRVVYLVAVEADVRSLAALLPRNRKLRARVLGVYCGAGDALIPGLIRHLGPDCSRGSEIALVVDADRALIGCTQPEDAASAALTQNAGVVGITEQYVKHEVFLNSRYDGKDRASIEAYIADYERTMKDLP